MDVLEKALVTTYHRQCLQTYEHSPAALGWLNTKDQVLRFEELLKVGNLNGCSVLDLGCGRGDLLSIIDQKFSDVTYVGIDMMSEFIDDARRQYANRPKTFFFHADFVLDGLPEIDYVLASGALSYQTSNMLYPFTMINKMFTKAKRAIAFNLLDADQFVSNTILKSYDRQEIMSHCRQLSSRADLVTGYLPDDFTVLMYKA